MQTPPLTIEGVMETIGIPRRRVARQKRQTRRPEDILARLLA